MESAIFGLVGVVIGALLTVAKEWWFQRRKTLKDIEYLSIQVTCELERFASSCTDVASDDGSAFGQPGGEGGYYKIQVKAPVFDPKLFDVEWKSLPATLMYQVLNFPYKAETANQSICAIFEHVASPPEFQEGFEERQLQYACLGITALKLAAQLRTLAGLPPREVSEWNPESYLINKKTLIEAGRIQNNSNPALTEV